MAKAFKCDRCQTLYENNIDDVVDFKGRSINYKYINKVMIDTEICDFTMDLCPPCIKKLADFLNNEGENKNETT